MIFVIFGTHKQWRACQQRERGEVKRKKGVDKNRKLNVIK